MEGKPRFTLGKRSSLAPDRESRSSTESEAEEIDNPSIRLMRFANEGYLEGIEEILNSGLDINFQDVDGRTALHVAASQGRPDVVNFLLERGAMVELKDRWGSTPLADAAYYKNQDVVKLLDKLPLVDKDVKEKLESHLFQAVAALLECNICVNGEMVGNIYQCSAGHKFCSNCVPKLTKCAYCSAMPPFSRLLALEELRDSFQKEISALKSLSIEENLSASMISSLLGDYRRVKELLGEREGDEESLLINERLNDLEAAKSTLIEFIKTQGWKGTKMVGLVDEEPFIRLYESVTLGRNVRSFWQDQVNGGAWFPFKFDGAKPTIGDLDFGDHHVNQIKVNMGEEILTAIVTAVLELNVHICGGKRVPALPRELLWDDKEKGEAKLSESLDFVLKRMSASTSASHL